MTLAAVLQRHVLNSRQLGKQVAELRQEVRPLANAFDTDQPPPFFSKEQSVTHYTIAARLHVRRASAGELA